MTSIVAVKGKHKIVIGCDSCGSDGITINIRKDKKIFTNGEFVIGFTDSFRMGQILMDLKVPKQKDNDDFKYMRTIFINSVRKSFEKNGFIEEEKYGGEFIVIYRKNIYKVYKDFQIEMVEECFNATGSGEQTVFGVLETLKRQNMNFDLCAKHNVQLALEICEKYNIGVRGPYHFIEIDL